MIEGWLPTRDVEARVIDLVARARSTWGIVESCSGVDACAKLGLRLERASLAGGRDGMLTGQTIVVEESLQWQPRIEFTIFHEVTHHLLNEDGELYEYFTERLRRDQRAFDVEIERCCHLGAAEFLMPRAHIRQLIEQSDFSLNLIETIAQTHHSSLVAAAIQLGKQAPIRCYIVIACRGTVSERYPPYTGLHVEYAVWPQSVRYPLARRAPIAADHLLSAAWDHAGTISGPTYVPFPSGKRMPCDGQAQRLGSRVVGILYLDSPSSQDQLSLFVDS
jgi:IrrE N-terminal-like domain